jgi:hypothetical protein
MSVHLVVREMESLLHALRFHLMMYAQRINDWIENSNLDGSDNQLRLVDIDDLARLFNRNDYRTIRAMYTTYARKIRPTIDMNSFGLGSDGLEMIEPILCVVRRAISYGMSKSNIIRQVHQFTGQQSFSVFCQCIAEIAKARDVRDE